MHQDLTLLRARVSNLREIERSYTQERRPIPAHISEMRRLAECDLEDALSANEAEGGLGFDIADWAIVATAVVCIGLLAWKVFA